VTEAAAAAAAAIAGAVGTGDADDEVLAALGRGDRRGVWSLGGTDKGVCIDDMAAAIIGDVEGLISTVRSDSDSMLSPFVSIAAANFGFA
jgi:hypothetical protein